MTPAEPSRSEMPAASVILPSTGFAVMGLFSFGLTCVILLLRPDTLSGDPVRGSVLALTHLVTLGWIGSLLIAGAYLIGPVLAGSPLWSQKLPTLHLVCHSVGLALLLGGLAVLRYDVAGVGAAALVVGLAALILNLLMTSARRSLWTPANLAFQSALFWLAVTGAVALLMLHARGTGRMVFQPEMLIALHAHYALFGFLAQAMLGVSLRLLPGLNDTEPEKSRSNRLSWMGWICLNAGLLTLFPTVYSGSEIAVTVSAALIGLGVLGFAAEIGVLLFHKHTHRSWGTWTHATGVLLLVLIIAVAIWNFPRGEAAESGALREWMRMYISLSLLGPFAFTILGTGERILPRLVWQLRYAPWKSFGVLPPPESLGLRAAGGPVYFSLILAWTYLAYGQAGGGAAAIQLGAALLMTALVWFLVAVSPALLRLLIGVTPADLSALPPSSRPSPVASADSLQP